MIWVETPTNPLLKLVDLAARRRDRAQARHHLRRATTPSPRRWIQRPLELGFDIVVHSTTKYLNGHSDVIGGAAVVCKDDELAGEARASCRTRSAACRARSTAFLALRGIKTLALRMERHCGNAMHIAAWLEKHPKVERVIYPGLASHPQHVLAARQMNSATAAW